MRARRTTSGVLGLFIFAGSAIGAPPFAIGRGLHGAGVFTDLIAADLDRDGRLDLIGAMDDGRIVTLPARARTEPIGSTRTISTNAGIVRAIASVDLDRDGDLDVLSAGADAIRWHENRAGDAPDPANEAPETLGWRTHEIAISVEPGAIVPGDLDRDGDPDLLIPGESGLDLRWLESTPGDEDAPIGFTEAITIPLGAAPVALIAADLNADGWMDGASLSSLGAAVHLRDPGLPSFTTVFIDGAPDAGADLIALDADRDGDLDLAAAGDDGAVLLANGGDGLGWIVTTIASDIPVPRRIHGADLDLDGRMDFVVESAGQSATALLHDGVGYEALALRLAVVGYGPLAPADLDRDGDIDVIGAMGRGGLLWRENRLIHRSMALPERRDIDAGADGAFNIAPGDLDGDGDLDLASAAFNAGLVSWHERLDDGSFLTHPVMDGASGPLAVVIADLDLDGRSDIAGATTGDGAVRWHRNLGGDPPTFETRLVAGDAQGVFGLALGDLNRDGRPDLISAEKNTDRVRWFENRENGGGILWTARAVSDAVPGAFNVHSADIDGDGWLDVLSAARDNDSIYLHRNLGGDPPAFETVPIAGGVDDPACVHAADLDLDGDLDLLSASRRDGTVRWFENTGDGEFMARTIDAAAPGATWVRAADLDADGDLDVGTAARDVDLVVVYENLGGSPPVFARRPLAEPAGFVSCVEPADLNGDGRMDLAIAAVTGDLIAWHPNAGGGFAPRASAIAPGSIPAWGVGGLVRLDAVSRAREAEGDIRVMSLALRFEGDAGDPLTSEQLRALVQRLTLHADDGDGVFDPIADGVVLEDDTLELVDGVLALSPPEEAGTFAPGQARTWFIAVRMAAEAGNQDPGSFAIVYLGERLVALDTTNDAPVSIEDARDMATDPIEATCPADVTGSDDPDDPGFGVPDGVVNQADFFYYNDLYDAGDLDADLTSVDDPDDPAYAIPDGIVDTRDLFFYLDRFSEGC